MHDDVMEWKPFPRYWPFVWGIHRSAVNSPHKGQWRGPSMFSLICTWIIGWVNNGEAGDLRRHCAHYDVIVMDSYHSAHIIHIKNKSTRRFPAFFCFDNVIYIRFNIYVACLVEANKKYGHRANVWVNYWTQIQSHIFLAETCCLWFITC